jgi:O-antigen/teichoic acid export membrane protein
MSVYLPAMVLQKALGMGRLILLTRFLSSAEMGDWGLGLMIFTLGAPLVTLGANHSLVRYVSLFEVRGMLGEFYRKACWWVVILAVILTAAGVMVCQPLLEAAIFVKVKFLGADVVPQPFPWRLAIAILCNVGLMGVYISMMSFIYGLRVYRLASVLEVMFTAMFSVLALTFCYVWPSALTMLWTHAAALGIVVVVGILYLNVAVRRLCQPDVRQEVAPELAGPVPMEPSADADSVAVGIPIQASRDTAEIKQRDVPAFSQVLKFGLLAMVGSLIWCGAGYISFFMIYMRWGDKHAGPFMVIMRLSQPIIFIANAVWGVLFAHVASRWEKGDRRGAMFVLETAYKSVTLVMMTLAMLIYLASPLWIRVLAEDYQYVTYVSGLLTFYMTVCNMTLLTILAKLHERPIVIALAALAGGGMIAILAALWMPIYGALIWGEVGAARAAGVGMYFGGGMVTLVYLLSSRTRLHDSTYFVFGTPVLLLLPAKIVAPIWAVVLPVCVFSSWVFTSRQKQVLRETMRKGWASFKQVHIWR